MIFDKLFGAKAKEPFRPPREAAQLRSAIDAEMKENFPKRERYRELSQNAEDVYRVLDTIVAQKEHRDEAIKLQDDLRKRLGALGQKIKGNISGTTKDKSDDYLDNIDYLERKSVRNNAKTLYTEFLDAHVLFTGCLNKTGADRCDRLGAASATLVKTLSALEEQYFSKYTQDKELQGLKATAVAKLTEAGNLFEANKAKIENWVVKTQIEQDMVKLQALAHGTEAQG